MKRFRGGLVCKAHRLVHHSTLGLRVMRKKQSSHAQRLRCRLTCLDVPPVQSFSEVPRSKENAPPQDPTEGLCLGSQWGPKGMGVLLWARYPCTLSPDVCGQASRTRLYYSSSKGGPALAGQPCRDCPSRGGPVRPEAGGQALEATSSAHTMDCDPVIKSQLAARDSLEGLMR